MTAADDHTAAAPTPPGSIPKPRITWKGVGIAAGLWVLFTIAYALLIAQGEGVPFTGALVSIVYSNTLLALTSIPVWWMVVREMDDVHGGWVLLAHLGLAPLYSWINLEMDLWMMSFGAPVAAIESMEQRYHWIFFTYLTIYAVQFAIFHLVRSVQRLRLKEQQATELMALAHERELEALKAQVNPHFLFNTLNSISATVKVDPDEAREMIAELAHLLRYALDSAQNDWVTLQDEVDFARAYLTLESHRFSDRLGVEYDVDPDALDTSVPPMVLQPLVENAIKHGIAQSESGGTVTLRVHRSNGHVNVRVEDTGAGLNGTADPVDEDTEGLSLANTNARLTQTYGPEAALHTNADASDGFEVWFNIPRKEGRDKREE